MTCTTSSGCSPILSRIYNDLKCFFNFVSLRFFDGVINYEKLDLDQIGTVVNSRASMLEDYEIFNSTVNPLYVKFYNKAGLAVATDVPVIRLLIPAQSGANLSLLKRKFATGIAIRGTVGVTDADVVSPPTNGLIVNIGYRSL